MYAWSVATGDLIQAVDDGKEYEKVWWVDVVRKRLHPKVRLCQWVHEGSVAVVLLLAPQLGR